MTASWATRRGVAALLLLLAPARAQAQTPSDGDRVAAEALFGEGKRLLLEGRYEEACPKLAESQRRDPAIGTLLHLGECYDQSGQTASAWSAFRSAESLARSRKQPDREKIAQERAAEMERRLSKLVVIVAAPDAVPGLEVRCDRSVVGPAAWGTALPLDPGSHVVEATAPGRKAWKKTVTLASGGVVERLAIPPLEALPAQQTKDRGADSARHDKEVAVVPSGRGDTQRLVGLLTGVGGVAVLGIGVVYGLRSSSKKETRDDHCVRGLPDCDTLDSQTRTAATYANLGYIVGAAAIAGGAVLYLTAPQDKPVAKSARVGVGLGWVNLEGTW